MTMRRLVVPIEAVQQQGGMQAVTASSTMLLNGAYAVRMVAYGMSGQVYESTGQVIIIR
jgi:hypothetical protein